MNAQELFARQPNTILNSLVRCNECEALVMVSDLASSGWCQKCHDDAVMREMAEDSGTDDVYRHLDENEHTCARCGMESAFWNEEPCNAVTSGCHTFVLPTVEAWFKIYLSHAGVPCFELIELKDNGERTVYVGQTSESEALAQAVWMVAGMARDGIRVNARPSNVDPHVLSRYKTG